MYYAPGPLPPPAGKFGFVSHFCCKSFVYKGSLRSDSMKKGRVTFYPDGAYKRMKWSSKGASLLHQNPLYFYPETYTRNVKEPSHEEHYPINDHRSRHAGMRRYRTSVGCEATAT